MSDGVTDTFDDDDIMTDEQYAETQASIRMFQRIATRGWIEIERDVQRLDWLGPKVREIIDAMMHSDATTQEEGK